MNRSLPGAISIGMKKEETRMEEKDWCFAWFIEKDSTGGADRQGLAKDGKWMAGDVITVSFLDGEDSLRERVKTFAREWTAKGMANLNFGFLDDEPDTMVRISFQFGGNWSLIGRDCLKRTNQKLPTMNLELAPDSPDDLVRRKVLHEFGHALGLIHEHQVPNAGIKWDREKVIADLSGPPNKWSVDEIESNVLVAAEIQETNSIQFDPKSIMVYPIPSGWTENGFTVEWNTELSDADKKFIRDQYN